MDLSAPGQFVGTIAYMPPEQILGQTVDQRSDLFAFGIILYEMLAGQHPWLRAATVDTLHAILHDDPPSMPSNPPPVRRLSPLVQKLLSKNPRERYASAEEVLDALANLPAHDDGMRVVELQPLTSIAVLPFIFLNEVDEHKALSLGFADAVITILSNLENVVVTPTSSILGYTSGVEPRSVCSDLGVNHALQANVQKVGTQWRVSIQLFDAKTHRVTFAEKHDFALENVFEVQDEIGRRVVESLQTRFPLTAARSRDRYSSDPEAYEQFMIGLRESYSSVPEVLKGAARHH